MAARLASAPLPVQHDAEVAVGLEVRGHEAKRSPERLDPRLARALTDQHDTQAVPRFGVAIVAREGITE
jgi:hypothetical protein